MPDRDLGQNFLIDDNVLELIGRLVPLAATDVGARGGAGAGRADPLAGRARGGSCTRSRSTAGSSRRWPRAWPGWTTSALQFADALRVDPQSLDPPPGVLCANLPYNVATPVVMEWLPHCERFCVMVQREIADRLFAEPRHEEPTAPSRCWCSCAAGGSGRAAGVAARVLAGAERRLGAGRVRAPRRMRRSGRGWARAGGGRPRRVLAPPQDAGQLAGAGRPAAAARAVRPAAGRAAGARAVPGAACDGRPGAGQDQPGAARRARSAADGFHRLATLFQALDLHDDVEITPAEATPVEGFEADTLVTRALELLGETAHVRLTKRIPVAGGLGGGSSDAAAVLRHYARRRKVDELYAIARDAGVGRAVLPVRPGDRAGHRPRRPAAARHRPAARLRRACWCRPSAGCPRRTCTPRASRTSCSTRCAAT